MIDFHGYIAIVVIGLNLVAGLWGCLAWLYRRATTNFWYILRLAQASVVAQVTLGAIIFIADHEPSDKLHLVYGVLPLVVMLVGEGLRVGVAARIVGDRDIHKLDSAKQQEIAMQIVRREMGIMAVACLLIVALSVRAAMTAGYF